MQVSIFLKKTRRGFAYWKGNIIRAQERFTFEVNYDSTNLVHNSIVGTVPTNTWQYVTLTWDGSSTATNVHFYINGVPIGTVSPTNGSTNRVSDVTSTFYLGINQV